jgi:hypothetical protein
LLTYALGRSIDYTDNPTIRKITREGASNDYRWSSIILGIVKSTPFQYIGGETAGRQGTTNKDED